MNKTIIVQISIIIAIVAGYFFIDFNSLSTLFDKEVLYKTQNEKCDLHKKACSVKLDNNKVATLEVFPKSIPLMENLRFKIDTNFQLKEDLVLKIYATNMYMGEFSFKLKKLKENTYEAVGMLPTCPVGNMKWNADLNFKDDTGARFLFQTGR